MVRILDVQLSAYRPSRGEMRGAWVGIPFAGRSDVDIVNKSVVRPDVQKDVDVVRAIEGFVRGFYKPPSTRRYSLILIEPLVPGSSG